MICSSGEDDADVDVAAERVGDDGAECIFGSTSSSLDGDPARGVAIGLSCSSAPPARCSGGDAAAAPPVSTTSTTTLPGSSSRDPETDGGSSPSTAAHPDDDEAEGESYASASSSPAAAATCGDLHDDVEASRHAAGDADAEAADASSTASSNAGSRGDLPSSSARPRGSGASEAAASPEGSSSMRARDRELSTGEWEFGGSPRRNLVAEEGRINQTPTDREGEEERRGEEGGGPRPEIVEGIING